METWIWISLWVVQTIVGAVLWRKYFFTEDYCGGDYESHELGIKSLCFGAISLVVVPIMLCCYSFMALYVYTGDFISFLAGVKNKTEENDNI